MNKHIAIIGAGNIGSRHLQALALMDRDIDISVFDPSRESLDLAKSRFEELPKNDHVCSSVYSQSTESLDRAVDVAIVATRADVRKRVIEDLLKRTRVSYLLIEKVAFQSVADFEQIIGLLKNKNVKAWVNCSYRRTHPFYQEIRNTVHNSGPLFFNLFGGGWGLACNSIHMLDIFSYLTGESDLQLDGFGLDASVSESKRDGFLEFTGTLRGKTKGGSVISLLDQSGVAAPYTIQLFNQNAQYSIFESQEKAVRSLQRNNWSLEEVSVPIQYQSQLTHLFIQQILDTNDCALASIEEAFCLHKPMLNIFTDHLNTVTGKIHEQCLIT